MLAKINRLGRLICKALIKVYTLAISPLLGQHCRFYPSCSVYASEAIEEYGVVKGGFLALKRMVRCHPLHPGGVDQVPVNPLGDKTLVDKE